MTDHRNDVGYLTAMNCRGVAPQPTPDTLAAVAIGRLRAGSTITENDVREILRRMVEQDYPSLRAAARQWKCSAAMVSDVLRGNRHPGPTLLRVVGLRRVVTVEYCRQDDSGKPGNVNPVKRRKGARL